jgi:signal transduction histidine kinase
MIPERVGFRYKLEGVENDWQEAGTRRTTNYSNLGPGAYRFRVIACNNDGVWNEVGATLNFVIAPAWYQTIWFRVFYIAAAMAGLYMLYLFRLRQVTHQVRRQMATRLEERERIARDLHDTLLQGIQGLILKVDAAAKRMPVQEPFRQSIAKALDYGDEVMAEGRDRVRSLRGSSESLSDLPAAFQRVAEETPHDDAVVFKTVAEGSVRELHPLVLEESFLIGREAVINALSHSQGLKVEVEITYDPKQFRLRVRDDGRGIANAILEQGGRPGHWGLQGMRERAQKLGGELEVGNRRPGAGTEVLLTVPGSTAYRASDAKAKASWFRRIFRIDG